MRRPSARLAQVLLLVAAVLAFVGLGAVWLWQYRRGQPVDIDEAGYLSIAVNDYRGLHDGGIGGFWKAVMGPSIQAPLMTAATAPVFLVTGPGVLPGLLVPLALSAVLLVAAHLSGHEVGGRQVAWLTLTLTAAAPVLIMFQRSYVFAMPAATTSALMLWAVARSRNFDELGWSAAAGAFAGLVALSRTLTLAFLPALLLAGLVAVAAGPRRGRRAAGLGVAAGAGLVVAGPWYARNGAAVWDYLNGYGYGAARVAYGTDESLLSPDSWREMGRYVVATSGLPLTAIWTAGAVLLLRQLVITGRRDGLRAAVARVVRSRLMPAAVWVAWGLAALTSSGNKGTGFTTALVPALSLLTAWALLRLPRVPARFAVAACVGVLALNTAAAADPRSELAEPRAVHLPWLGDSVLVNGVGAIQDYTRGGQLHPASGQLTAEQGEAWHHAQLRVVRAITGTGPGDVLTVFGFRHRLVNLNSVGLERLLRGGPALPLTMIDPVAVPNREQAMSAYLTTGSAATACLLLTARGREFEIEPVVDAGLMARAAHDAGFARRTTVGLPDGRTVVVWRRPSSCPVTGGPP